MNLTRRMASALGERQFGGKLGGEGTSIVNWLSQGNILLLLLVPM